VSWHEELTVEDGWDFQSIIQMHIETINNLLSIVTQCSEKEDGHL